MELYLPYQTNPRTKRFMPGLIPHNKGKKWDEWLPEKHQERIRLNLRKGREKGNMQLAGYNSKPTLMLLNGKIIGAFKSATQAGLKTGINDRNIRYVCEGKRNHAGGFQWCYEENYRP